MSARFKSYAEMVKSLEKGSTGKVSPKASPKASPKTSPSIDKSLVDKTRPHATIAERGNRVRFFLSDGSTITGTYYNTEDDGLCFIDVENYKSLLLSKFEEEVSKKDSWFFYNEKRQEIIPPTRITPNIYRAAKVKSYVILGQVPIFGSTYKFLDKLNIRIEDGTLLTATFFARNRGYLSLSDITGFVPDVMSYLESFLKYGGITGYLYLKDGSPILDIEMGEYHVHYKVLGLTNRTSHEKNVDVLFNHLPHPSALPSEIKNYISKFGGTKRRRYSKRRRS